jgi:hypothetical protein
LLIISVFGIALAGAAASWCFRYSATHRSAQFWGPHASQLIRDAPWVMLSPVGSDQTALDLSEAHGLTHLRAALVEDHSYDWSAKLPPEVNWVHALVFAESEGAASRVKVLFSADFRWAAYRSSDEQPLHAVSTGPIADGLETFFSEYLPPAAVR